MAFALNLGSLNVTFGADTRPFDHAVRGMIGRVDKIGKRIERVGQRLTSIGRRMTIGLTVPIAGFGTAAIKSFASFDDAMTKSLSIMQGITPQLRKDMDELAITISKETTTSATDLARAYFFLASAGLDAQQSMAALPTVNKFAIAGAFDMALATDLLTDAQSALGLTIRDDVVKNMQNMVRVSDVLVKANTLANATVEQFSKSLTSKAGASLRALNKDVEEGVAVLAAMADQGVKAELAGERLSIVLRDLQKASIENQAVWDSMGLSVFDASGKMRNMADIISQLETLLGPMSDKQKQVTLSMLGFTFRSISATKGLLGTSEAIRKYEAQLRSASGITDEVANKQMKSFSAQLKIAWNNVTALGITIGRLLAPMISRVAGFIKNLTVWFQGLTETQQYVILGIAGIVAAGGPLLIMLGFAASSLASIISLVTGLISAFVTLGPIGLAVIGGLVSGLGLMVVKLIGPDSVMGAFDTAREFALAFFKDVLGFSDDTLKTLNKVFVGIKLGFSAVFLAGTLVWDGLMVAMKTVASTTLYVWGKVFGFLQSEFGKFEKTAGTIILSIGENLRNIPGFGDASKGLRDFGSALRTTGQRDIVGGRDNFLLEMSRDITKSAENNAVAIKNASDNFGKALGEFTFGTATFKPSELPKFSKMIAKDTSEKTLKDTTAGIDKFEIKTPKAPEFDIKVPDFNPPQAAVPDIGIGARGTDFRQIALRRFDIGQQKGIEIKRQEVTAPGIEKKLDDVVDAINAKPNVAVLG